MSAWSEFQKQLARIQRNHAALQTSAPKTKRKPAPARRAPVVKRKKPAVERAKFGKSTPLIEAIGRDKYPPGVELEPAEVSLLEEPEPVVDEAPAERCVLVDVVPPASTFLKCAKPTCEGWGGWPDGLCSDHTEYPRKRAAPEAVAPPQRNRSIHLEQLAEFA